MLVDAKASAACYQSKINAFKEKFDPVALSSTFAEYILGQLAESGNVVSRKMFGGLGIYVDDVFCALVSSSNGFYLRVGLKNIDDFKQLGMAKFAGRGGAGMPYYEVPEHVVEDSVVLSQWVARARDEALRARKKKRLPGGY